MARLCMRYVKNETATKEVLNEGFLKVFLELKRFEYRGAGSLAGWIRKIMVNQALMHLRKQRSLLFVDLEAAESRSESHFESSLSAVDSLSAEEISDLVASLPIGYRVVFNLYAIEGYSHKEVAELLGITESTSRSQLTHARTKLKELLTQKGWK